MAHVTIHCAEFGERQFVVHEPHADAAVVNVRILRCRHLHVAHMRLNVQLRLHVLLLLLLHHHVRKLLRLLLAHLLLSHLLLLVLLLHWETVYGHVK